MCQLCPICPSNVTMCFFVLFLFLFLSLFQFQSVFLFHVLLCFLFVPILELFTLPFPVSHSQSDMGCNEIPEFLLIMNAMWKWPNLGQMNKFAYINKQLQLYRGFTIVPSCAQLHNVQASFHYVPQTMGLQIFYLEKNTGKLCWFQMCWTKLYNCDLAILS